MSLSRQEIKELSVFLDARMREKRLRTDHESRLMSIDELAKYDALLRKRAKEERNDRLRQRRRLKVVKGDALSSGAMKLARAYDAADPLQRRCMDAIATVALVMQGPND